MSEHYRGGGEQFLPQERFDTTIPERKIPIEEVGNLIAAVGNNEAKAITLLGMQPGTIYSESNLHERVNSLQQKGSGWEMALGNTYHYCKNSLAPIGLVTREVLLNGSGNYGYMITEKGLHEGTALAGHLLSFSERHPELALNDIWGRTQSNSQEKEIAQDGGDDISFKDRAPLLRTKLYDYLLSSSLPVSVDDIEKGLDSSHSTVSNHVPVLDKAGLLTFKTYEANVYSPNPNPPDENPPKFRKMPTATQEIFEIVATHPDSHLTIDAVVEDYISQDPKRADQKALKKSVYQVLNHLAKYGYVNKDNNYTRVNLDASQRETLKELQGIVQGMQSPTEEFITDGKQKASRIMSDPERVASLMEKAQNASSHANSKSLENTKAIVVEIVKNNPDATSKEVQEILDTEFRITREIKTVAKYLTNAREDGELQSERNGKGLHWNVIEDNTL